MSLSTNLASPTLWSEWVDIVERQLGHSLDGDQERDGYSLDCALDCYKAGLSPEEYAGEVTQAKAALPAFFTVAVYLVYRAYGGPEEGGWYYECGERVDRLDTPGNGNIAVPRIFTDREHATRHAITMNNQLAALVNEGRPELYSVLSDGRYSARVCDGYPEPGFPLVKPHYE